MAEFREVVERRRSVRRYKPDPVLDGALAEILRLADTAPSAGGLKARQVVVTPEQLTRHHAPLNLVVCALPERSAKRYGHRGATLYAVQDATIYGAYVQLAAVDLGLATVWIGAFREGRVRRQLGLRDDQRPVAIILLGYEAE